MMTRRVVTHQYGQHAANGAPPPYHFYMHEHQYPEPASRAALYQHGGGLLGGAVSLSLRGATGMVKGGSGYGYLGLDPSDPQTWIRPFSPAPGMISYLNYGTG